jgi:hypothetical protein
MICVTPESNPIREEPPTWVSVADAARYSGVSRAVIDRAISNGRVRTRVEGATRLVALESVLSETVSQDIERLRARIERAAFWEGAPDAVP